MPMCCCGLVKGGSTITFRSCTGRSVIKAADYETLVKWWATHSENRPLFIGQSVVNTIQHADPKNPKINQLPRKMALQRAYQTIGGSCQWYAGAVVEKQGYVSGCFGEGVSQVSGFGACV